MKPTKKYQVWLDYGLEGWQFYDYDNLKEAIDSNKHECDWVITKLADYKIVEIIDLEDNE